MSARLPYDPLTLCPAYDRGTKEPHRWELLTLNQKCVGNKWLITCHLFCATCGMRCETEAERSYPAKYLAASDD
jgi:hypothetical protein